MFESLKKKIAGKVFNKKNESTSPFVPFDLKPGSVINISTTIPTVYDAGFKSLSLYNVERIGKFRIGDCDGWNVEMDQGYTLEVITNNKEIEQCRLYKTVAEDMPTTENKWDAILGEKGSIRAYTFEHDGNVYVRLDSYADPDPDFVDPVEYTVEYDNDTKFVTCMCFGRWLDEDLGVAGYVLLSVVEGDKTACVETKCGVDVSPMEII
jgi:hypothetical protein